VKKENKKIIIAASGTGGHIYPGLSLAEEFKNNGYDAVFFVNSNPASIEIMAKSGFKYVKFNMSGMPRKFSFSFVKFLLQLFSASIKSFFEIIKINPSAVIGTGGYVSVPAIISAKILFKKTYVHEQNSIPGAANKFLSKMADIAFLSFESSKEYFKNSNAVVCGYPVRKDILNASKKDAVSFFGLKDNVFTVLVFGGSLGAAKLNEIAFNALSPLAKNGDIQVLHISGIKDYPQISKTAGRADNYKVFPYLHNIAAAYAVADIVVCRSGAGAVFEIKALGKPAVLVPYPFATDNHQFYNAKAFEKSGFIEVIEEKDLTDDVLLEFILKIKNSISKKAFDVFSPDAIYGEAAAREYQTPQLSAQEIIVQYIKG